jgi:hypothetical protein
VAFLVLSVGLLFFAKGPTSSYPLGLVDCAVADFVVGFSTGIFHCACQSLIIQSISSPVM